jgi:hypothetical protein
MRDAFPEDVRRLIAETAAGAGDGADALRRSGSPVVLEGYTVEVLFDSVEAPAASVRVTFVPMDPGGAHR